jgi:hypothetical protein
MDRRSPSPLIPWSMTFPPTLLRFSSSTQPAGRKLTGRLLGPGTSKFLISRLGSAPGNSTDPECAGIRHSVSDMLAPQIEICGLRSPDPDPSCRYLCN